MTRTRFGLGSNVIWSSEILPEFVDWRVAFETVMSLSLRTMLRDHPTIM
jgi:hypothetical protein